MWLFERDSKNFVRVPLPVKGRLYASPMPYGPYDPFNQLMRTYRRHRIDRVVPLVTQDEIERKCKRDLLGLYLREGMQVTHFPVADLTSPRRDDMEGLLSVLDAALRAGERIVVHCNAGLGRTSVVLCCIVRRVMGLSGADAIAHVSNHLMINMNDEQRRLVCKWAWDEEALIST